MYVAVRGSLSPPATENDFWVKNSVFNCSLLSVFYCSLVFDMFFFFSHFLFIIGMSGLAYAHHNKSLNLIVFLQFSLFINVWKYVFLFFFFRLLFFGFFDNRDVRVSLRAPYFFSHVYIFFISGVGYTCHE